MNTSFSACETRQVTLVYWIWTAFVLFEWNQLISNKWDQHDATHPVYNMVILLTWLVDSTLAIQSNAALDLLLKGSLHSLCVRVTVDFSWLTAFATRASRQLDASTVMVLPPTAPPGPSPPRDMRALSRRRSCVSSFSLCFPFPL